MASADGSPPWPIRCVAFDLDGLMLDTERIFEEAARLLLSRRGLNLNETVMRSVMGTTAKQALPVFHQGHDLTCTVEELGLEWRAAFMELLGDGPAPLLPGVVQLLDRLERRGLPRAIVTSSSAAYVQRVFAPHGLLDRFAFVLTAEDVKLGKPHPEVYEKAAARFGHAASDMLVLEDSVNGLRAAKGAGARCVVVPHALVPIEQLIGADLIVPSLEASDLSEALGL
ncbi:MAG: HAD family phosphatase [Gemmataceae bacterium]|nr:HAD family phosphatase [Gemmataceae bacterium]